MASKGVTGKAGDTVCRPSEWTDVAKFFLMNYVLHILTVISDPGSRTFPVVNSTVGALGLPFSGIGKALTVIYGCTGRSSPLETALRAGALCMVVPTAGSEGSHLQTVWPELTDIHGQYPVPLRRLPDRFENANQALHRDSENNQPEPQYRLVVVPKWFTVHPLLKEYPCEPQIACNYNILKSVAAMMQIVYGSFELYNARGRQIERYGYAAYSLTVIPYILMSLVNLFATLCAPQYPEMFIVLYQGPQKPDTVGGITSCQQRDPESTGVGERDCQQQLETATGEMTHGQENEIELAVHRISHHHEHEHEHEHETSPGNSATTAGHQDSPHPEASVVGEHGRVRPNGWTIEDFQVIKTMISGAVGEVYGEWEEPEVAPTKLSRWMKEHPYRALAVFVGAATAIAPYVIIYLLTGFENAQSTVSQRSWVMVWLVIGEFYGAVAFRTFRVPGELKGELGRDTNGFGDRAPIDHTLIQLTIFSTTLIFSVGALGGLVVVGKMILEHEVCVNL